MLPTALRFLAGGGANTLATLVLYWLLLLVMPAQAAYAISFAAGLAIGYVLNTGFVFRTRRRWRHVIGYPLVYLCAYAAGALVLGLAVHRWHVDPRVAPLLSLVVSVPLTFLLLRLLLRPQAE